MLSRFCVCVFHLYGLGWCVFQCMTFCMCYKCTEEHDKSGIYKHTCNTCEVSYIGQTSHSLHQRYKEHVRYIMHNNPQSLYALHILKNKQKCGPINDTKTLLKHINRTTLLTLFEQLYIQTTTIINSSYQNNT